MAVIDSNNLVTHLVWSGLVDNATCGELKKAIELCTIKDVYTIDEVIAILEEIQLEIENIFREEEVIDKKWANGLHYSEKIIKQKINALKKVKDADSN